MADDPNGAPDPTRTTTSAYVATLKRLAVAEPDLDARADAWGDPAEH